MFIQKYFYLNDEPESVVDGGESPQQSEPPTKENGATEQEIRDYEAMTAALKKRLAERDDKLQSVKSEAEQLKAKLAEIEAKEQEAQAEQERKAAEARQAKLLEQQKYEELMAEKEREAAKAIAEKDQRIQELLAKINQSSEMSQTALVERDFVQAFTASDGFPDQADLLLPKYQRFLRYNYESRKTEVINPATNEVMTNDLGEPYTLRNFVDGVIKSERPSSFKAAIKSGTGASPQGENGATVKAGNYNFNDLLKMKGSARAQILNNE